MYQYNLLYFANYYTLSNIHSTNLQYLHLFTQMSEMMAIMDSFPVPTAYYKVIQFHQLLCFLSCCSSHSVCK